LGDKLYFQTRKPNLTHEYDTLLLLLLLLLLLFYNFLGKLETTFNLYELQIESK